MNANGIFNRNMYKLRHISNKWTVDPTKAGLIDLHTLALCLSLGHVESGPWMER